VPADRVSRWPGDWCALQPDERTPTAEATATAPGRCIPARLGSVTCPDAPRRPGHTGRLFISRSKRSWSKRLCFTAAKLLQAGVAFLRTCTAMPAASTAAAILACNIPHVYLERTRVKPSDWSKLEREHLLVTNQRVRAQIFIGSYDYGNNLAISWYLVVTAPDLFTCLSTGNLNLFQQQQLKAFVWGYYSESLARNRTYLFLLPQDNQRCQCHRCFLTNRFPIL
jgi:hypothetical protein